MILGDADCISNVELFKSREEIESGNFYIILGSFAWLSDGEAPVDVRRPKSIDNRLFLGKTGVKVTDILFKWFIPIVLLIGAISWPSGEEEDNFLGKSSNQFVFQVFFK